MNEEIGIDALAPPWRVLLCVALPKTKPTADGFCPFRAQVGCEAWRVGMCVAWVVRALRMLVLGAVELQILSSGMVKTNSLNQFFVLIAQSDKAASPNHLSFCHNFQHAVRGGHIFNGSAFLKEITV